MDEDDVGGVKGGLLDDSGNADISDVSVYI